MKLVSHLFSIKAKSKVQVRKAPLVTSDKKQLELAEREGEKERERRKETCHIFSSCSLATVEFEGLGEVENALESQPQENQTHKRRGW